MLLACYRNHSLIVQEFLCRYNKKYMSAQGSTAFTMKIIASISGILADPLRPSWMNLILSRLVLNHRFSPNRMYYPQLLGKVLENMYPVSRDLQW